MTTQTVTIRYKVDSNGAVQATGAVVKTVTQLGAAATKTNSALQAQARTVNSIQGALREYTQNLRSLFGLYLTFQGVQTFSRFIDEYTNLNGRLKVVIDNTQKYAVAQTQVYAIAQATYSSLSATANLYARLTVSLEELNSSQNEVALITKTVNQALLVSGATSAEASSAIIQLSQSFASGVLRGEEFNAVNEAAPRIMTALAKSLNVSRGALREMASEGKLTAEVLRKALVDDAANISKEAANVPLTIGRGYESLRNDLLKFVGGMDKVYGVSTFVAEGLRSLGKNIGEVGGALASAIGYVALFAGAKGLAGLAIAISTGVTSFATIQASALAFGAALGGLPALIAAAVVGFVALTSYLFEVTKQADAATVALGRFGELSAQSPKTALWDTLAAFQATNAEIQRMQALVDQGIGLDEAGRLLVPQINDLKDKLAQLSVNGKEAMMTLASPLLDAAKKGFDDIGMSVDKYANAQRTLNATLIASGTPLGRQLKAAEELKAGLLALDQQSKKGINTAAMEDQQRRQLLSTYTKELATIGKSTEVKQKSVASDLARASATERLNNIIAQFSREQDDSNKILKQLAGVQLEVNNLVRKHPKLAELAAQATKLIGEAAAEATDKFREFKESVKTLLDDFGQGNINKASSDLAILSIALDEALSAGNSAEASRIVDAMQAIEQQAGLSASAADTLRASNEQLAESAREQSQAYEAYWEGAFTSIGDAIGEFVADGMRNWKSFGDSLKSIAKKIIADIISEFLKLKVINPILNQLFGAMQNGAMRPTGGGGLLSSLTGGGGGFNLQGILSSIFGGGGSSISAGMGIQQINVIRGGANISSAGGSFMSGGGMMANGMSMGGMLGAGGGIVMGLQGIRSGNALQGAAGGAMAGMSIAGPWGALIGGIIGGLGALINGKKEPDFRLGGSQASIRNREGGFSTVFGNVQAGSRQLSWESLVQPIQQFDLAIQDLVNSMGGGAPQLAAITTALATWEVDLRGSAATAENILNSRFSAILTTFSTDVQEFVGTAGTAQERVGRLTDALAIEAAVAAGELGDTFAGVADLLVDYRIGTETLADTYNRVLGSVQLLDGVVGITGVSFDLARDDFVRFAADIVEAAGGLERASQLWQGYFQTFYSEEERQAYAIQSARSTAGAELADIGLNIADFQGDGALAQFRQLFEEALPTLSAEATVQWLEAANALGLFVSATSELNAVIEEPIEAITSLADLMSTVASELAEFSTDTLTFAERIQVLNSDIESLVQRAVALGASEEQLASIRELGQRRLGVILAEQNAALRTYDDFIVGFQADPSAGLSDFRAELQRIATESSAAAAEANRLAIAAGLAGAAASDLALIQQHAAELAAQAAARLEASILSLSEQLGYAADEAESRNWGDTILGIFHQLAEEQAGTGGAAALDPTRYNLALTLGGQLRDLAEFTGDSMTDLMERLRIPFARLMTDFGVSIENIGNPEIFDRLATASRTMGIELADAASQLGVSIGQLSDASSILNDGFERAVNRLPSAVSSQLTTLLRGVENAVGPEAQAEAQRRLTQYVNEQPIAIRNALAPYLDGVDTTSVQAQQLSAAEQTNRYLRSSNEYLAMIAANARGSLQPGGTLVSPAGPGAPKVSTESSDKVTHELLRGVITAVGAMERELRAKNMKTTIGANNG